MNFFLHRLILITLLVFFGTELSAQPRVEKHLLGKSIEGLSKEENTVYFLMFGDFGRNGQGYQQDVADWMGIAANQVDARFVISTGDNFYCCGVASTEDYQWISSFENVYRCHSLQIPWYLVLGNHDYQGSVQAEIDYTNVSRRWTMPDRYYTEVLNGVRFLFVDTSPFVKDYYPRTFQYTDLIDQDTTRQLQWIDSVLSVSKEKWKIVVGHHPVYSVGNHGGEPELQKNLRQLLEKYKVQLYLAGHDHNLQSLRPKDSEVSYLISGGGAEETPVNKKASMARFAESTSGFMVAALKADTLDVYFIDKNGKLIYKEHISD